LNFSEEIFRSIANLSQKRLFCAFFKVDFLGRELIWKLDFFGVGWVKGKKRGFFKRREFF
jgi:hypothetical protein